MKLVGGPNSYIILSRAQHCWATGRSGSLLSANSLPCHYLAYIVSIHALVDSAIMKTTICSQEFFAFFFLNYRKMKIHELKAGCTDV